MSDGASATFRSPADLFTALSSGDENIRGPRARADMLNSFNGLKPKTAQPPRNLLSDAFDGLRSSSSLRAPARATASQDTRRTVSALERLSQAARTKTFVIGATAMLALATITTSIALLNDKAIDTTPTAIAAVEQVQTPEKPERLLDLEKIYGDLSQYQTLLVLADSTSGRIALVEGMEPGTTKTSKLKQVLEQTVGDLQPYRVVVAYANKDGYITAIERSASPQEQPLVSYYKPPAPKPERQYLNENNAIQTATGPTVAVEHKFFGATVPKEVDEALIYAAKVTGNDYATLRAIAYKESRFAADITNPESSACGMMQFVKGTLLETVYNHGHTYGYGDLADKIKKTSNGGKTYYSVKKASYMKDLQKACNTDHQFSAVMAGAYINVNKDITAPMIKRELKPVENYFTHFLGAEGAAEFLAAYDHPRKRHQPGIYHASKPSVERNKGVFYYPDDRKTYGAKANKPRSVIEVYKEFSKVFPKTDPAAEKRLQLVMNLENN